MPDVNGKVWRRIPRSSKYKYVAKHVFMSEERWANEYQGTRFFSTEKEAAKAVDILLIKQGKEPVNVLKRL